MLKKILLVVALLNFSFSEVNLKESELIFEILWSQEEEEICNYQERELELIEYLIERQSLENEILGREMSLIADISKQILNNERGYCPQERGFNLIMKKI